MFGSPAVALAAPPQPPPLPNGAASNNCVATTSGKLFSLAHNGTKLGRDVSQGAAGGGQASFVQAQLAKQGVNCPPSP